MNQNQQKTNTIKPSTGLITFVKSITRKVVVQTIFSSLLLFASLVIPNISFSQTTVIITNTGTAGSFNSGSVSSAGVKNDGQMININTGANRGWANYNLASIPSGSTITAVNILFTTFSTTLSSAANNVYGFTGSPSALTGAALYTACGSGSTWNNSSWSANALQTKAGTAAAVTALNAALASGTINVGYVRASTNNYNIHGYGGASPPQLQITFTPPPCTGTPAPGNTNATVSLFCNSTGGTSVLSLQNGTGAGATYQWYSSPTGLSGTYTAIASATSASYTATVSSNTYYYCDVTCAGATGSSTPKLISVIVPPNVSVTTSNPTFCSGTSGVALSAASTDATPPAFTWSPATTPATGAIVNVQPAATTIYTVTATATTGCTSTSTVSIAFSPGVALSSTTASPGSVCNPNTSQLNTNASFFGIVTCSPSIFTSTADEEIGNVTFPSTPGYPNAINNTTPNIAVSPIVGSQGGTASGTPSVYSNWTASSTPVPTVTAGSTYPFASLSTYTSTTSTFTNITKVFIDFNQDGTFGASETFACPSGSGTRTVTTNIIIPTTAYNGKTRMRVVLNESATLAEACGSTYNWGEVEDYSVIIDGGVDPFTYAWSSDSYPTPSTVYTAGEDLASSIFNIKNPVADYHTTMATTIYTVTVSTPTGCTKAGTVVLNVVSPGGGAPTLSVTSSVPASNTICTGKPITVNAEYLNGGAPFVFSITAPNGAVVWTPTITPPAVDYNSNTISATFTPIVSGDYTITGSDFCGGGQQYTTVVTITINPLPIVTATSTQTLYCSAAANITAAGAVTYAWMPGTLTGATVTPELITPSTTFTITGTDANTCSSTKTITINKGTLPVISSFGSSAVALCAANTGVSLTANASSITTGPSTLLNPNTYGLNTVTNTGDDELFGVELLGSTGTLLANYSTCTSLGAGAINGLSASITEKYANYTNLPATVVKTGTTYTVNMRISNCLATAYSSGQALFIDLNRNGTFDIPAERVYGSPTTFAGGVTPAYTTTTFTINIPATATAGVTLMRFLIGENVAGNTYTTATTLSWGEVEDYLLNIQSGSDSIAGPVVWTSSDPATLPTTPTGSPISTNALTTSTSYTVTATTASGCTNTNSLSIAVGAPLTCNALTSTIASPFCANLTTTLSATTTGGGAPFTYAWTKDGSALPTTTSTLTANVSGVYQVTITDNCGQTCSTNITLTVNPSPTVVASNSGSVCGSTGSSTISATGANTYAWMPGSLSGSSNSVSPTATQIYTVTGTDLAGCTSTNTTSVGVGANPVIVSAIANPTSICVGGTSVVNAAGIVVSSGPQTAVSYVTMIPGATNNDASDHISNVTFPSASGYPNQINNSTGGADSIASINGYSGVCTSCAIPTIIAGQTYTLGTSVNNGGTEFAGAWIDFNRNGSYADAGEYVAITSVLGTTWDGLTAITIPTTATAGVTRLRVRSKFNVALVASDYNSVYTYGETEDYFINIMANVPLVSSNFVWNPGANTGASATYTGITSNSDYTVTATSAIGCTATSTASVTIGGAVSCSPITSSLGTTFCAGLTSTLTANFTNGGGPYTYSWSSGGTASTTTVNASGDYSVTISDNCGTTCMTNIVITVNSLPTVTASSSNTLICGSGSAILTAIGANTYAWTPGALTGSAATVSPTANTNYVVTGTDGNGCTATSNVAIVYSVNPIITTAIATPAILCPGSTATLTATAPTPAPSTYVFSSSTTTFSSITGTASTAVGDDGVQSGLPIGFSFNYNGASFTTFGVTTNGNLQLNALANNQWTNNLATAVGNAVPTINNIIAPFWDDNHSGTGNIQYLTSGTSPNRILTVQWVNTAIGGSGSTSTPTNNYQVVLHEGSDAIDLVYGSMSSANGLSGSIGITGNPGNFQSVTPGAVATASNSTANNAVSSVANLASGTMFTFTPPAATGNYNWADGTGSVGSTSTTTVTPTANTIYTVTLTNAAGCTATSTASVSISTAMVGVTTSPTTVLLGASATLTATGGSVYTWTAPATEPVITATIATVSVSPLTTSVYTVSSTTVDGCISSSTVQVIVNTIPPITLTLTSTPAACYGQASGYIDPVVTGTTSTITYTINPSGYSIGLSGQYELLPAGNYTITATDGVSTSTATITVGQPTTALVISMSSVNPACTGNTNGIATATTTGGNAFTTTGYAYLYTWSNTSNPSALYPDDDSIINLAPSTYEVSVEDAGGCIVTGTVTLTNPTAITITATATQIACNGGTGSVAIVTGGGTGTKTVTGSATTALMAGAYNYTATDANGCTATASATINAAPASVTITAIPTQIVCNGGTGSVSIVTGGGTGTIIVTGSATTSLSAGTYNYTATDSNGCTATASAIINAAPAAITGSSAHTACNTLTVGGQTYTASGTHNVTYTNAAGCDSVHTYNVTIKNSSAPSAIALIAACNATSITLPGGSTTSATSQAVTFTNAAGCDSVVTYTITYRASSATTNVSVTANGSYVLPWGTTVTSSGAYPNTYTNAAGCDSIVTYNVTINLGIKVCSKVFLAGCYDATTGLMYDSLRTKSLIPATTPYGTAPYTVGYGAAGTETVAPSVLAVTGNNAIVDWVYLVIRSKTNSSIILGTRSALVQRDGDVVDVDGVSPVLFPSLSPDNYFVSVKHRNHIGIMTAGVYSLSLVPNCIDYTATTTPLYVAAGKAGNPAPLTGAAKTVGTARALYAGNCNIDLAASAFRYITYNVTTASDRHSLFTITGGTSTINGYTIFDIDMNGFARFNGLQPDRNVILNNCAGSNLVIINEQTPN